jgi:hypothetical protein
MEAALTRYALNWGLGEHQSRSKTLRRTQNICLCQQSKLTASVDQLAYQSLYRQSYRGSHQDCYLAVHCELMAKMHYGLKLVLRF